jgi:hypothetical protein
MSRISNQVIERYHFEQFQKDYTLPPGTIIYGDNPDIIIEGERRIGIEITNFFLKDGSLPESEQVQSKIREKVVSEARYIYQMGNEKRIGILFVFDETNLIRNQRKLIRKLVDLAKKVA